MILRKFLLLCGLIIFALTPSGLLEAKESRIRSFTAGKMAWIVIDDRPLLCLAGSYQGLSATQRVSLVKQRLAKILTGERSLTALQSDLKVTEKSGIIGISDRSGWLVLADSASAFRLGLSRRELAERWRRQLIRVLQEYGAEKVGSVLWGVASWYGKELRGRKTANGEVFDETRFTAAHRSLKFGASVRVTNLNNNLSIRVTINDRGPYIKGREIDLSWAAAHAIGIRGLGRVKIEVLR